MAINSKIIIHLMGVLLVFNGGFMLLAALVSGLYGDGATFGIGLGAIATLLVGTLAMFFTRGHKKEVKRKEGYIIVAFGWIIMSASGVLPYILSGAIPSCLGAPDARSGGATRRMLRDNRGADRGLLRGGGQR